MEINEIQGIQCVTKEGDIKIKALIGTSQGYFLMPRNVLIYSIVHSHFP
jgi:hypothetical protein